MIPYSNQFKLYNLFFIRSPCLRHYNRLLQQIEYFIFSLIATIQVYKFSSWYSGFLKYNLTLLLIYIQNFCCVRVESQLLVSFCTVELTISAMSPVTILAWSTLLISLFVTCPLGSTHKHRCASQFYDERIFGNCASMFSALKRLPCPGLL